MEVRINPYAPPPVPSYTIKNVEVLELFLYNKQVFVRISTEPIVGYNAVSLSTGNLFNFRDEIIEPLTQEAPLVLRKTEP